MDLRLPKIKAWIDSNNPGDPLIPFSVALEERLAQLPSDEDREAAEKEAGATSNMGKITTAGYASLHVSGLVMFHQQLLIYFLAHSVFYLWTARDTCVDNSARD